MLFFPSLFPSWCILFLCFLRYKNCVLLSLFCFLKDEYGFLLYFVLFLPLDGGTVTIVMTPMTCKSCFLSVGLVHTDIPKRKIPQYKSPVFAF